MNSTESGMVTEVTAWAYWKAACARNSAGQPAGSLDEWGGEREERTAPMDVTESPMVTEVSVEIEKAFCARNSAGQPTGSLDEWGGWREERTPSMDLTESEMVTEVSAVQ